MKKAPAAPSAASPGAPAPLAQGPVHTSAPPATAAAQATRPRDAYTGHGGTYLRNPVTGVRTPVPPEAPEAPETPTP